MKERPGLTSTAPKRRTISTSASWRASVKILAIAVDKRHSANPLRKLARTQFGEHSAPAGGTAFSTVCRSEEGHFMSCGWGRQFVSDGGAGGKASHWRSRFRTSALVWPSHFGARSRVATFAASNKGQSGSGR